LGAGLEQFVSVDPATGAHSFDQQAWYAAASANAGWGSASWDSVLG